MTLSSVAQYRADVETSAILSVIAALDKMTASTKSHPDAEAHRMRLHHVGFNWRHERHVVFRRRIAAVAPAWPQLSKKLIKVNASLLSLHLAGIPVSTLRHLAATRQVIPSSAPNHRQYRIDEVIIDLAPLQHDVMRTSLQGQPFICRGAQHAR